MVEPLAGFTVGLAAAPDADGEHGRVSAALRAALECAGAQVLPAGIGSCPSEAGAVEHLVRAVVGRQVDAVVLTSPAAADEVDRAADSLGLRAQAAQAFAADVVLVCSTSPGAAARADRDTTERTAMAPRGADATVHVVASRLGRRVREVELAGTALRMQGRLAVIGDGDEVWLTARERALLEVLLERPGAVRSKRELLRRVWQGDEGDEHVVEVTVARLRRRLGPAAGGIETVVRRGYRACAVAPPARAGRLT